MPLDDLSMISEEDVILASEDFFQPEGRPPLAPGKYLSKSRTLTEAKTQSGNPCLKVKFDKFQTMKGEEVKDFPPFETLYFHKRKPFGGKGEISAVGSYLKACGLKYQGLTPPELKEQLNLSENTPVIVVVGWEQSYKEAQENQQFREGSDGKTYTDTKRTKFFSNGDGTYTHQKQEGSLTITARAKVSSYDKVK